MSYNKIGDVMVAQGNLPEALQSYQADLAIADRLTQSDPGNAGWQRDLAVSHGNIARVLIQTGEKPGAREAFRKAQAIMQRLTALSPTNATWKDDLAYITAQLADLN
jgi:predicted negative regulator of RcsB-dependent stress response